MDPKVLVGCPTSNHKAYCLPQYVNTIKSFSYKNYDVLLVDNSKTDSYLEKIKSLEIPVVKSSYHEYARDRVIEARNVLRDKVLQGDYDYFLSLEQDVIPPKQVIENLLGWKKPIVTGIVFHLFPLDSEFKEFKEIPLIALQAKEKGKLSFFDASSISKARKGLVKVDYCPMGCVLISKEVLEKIKFRYEYYHNTDNPEDVKWDDRCLCEDAKSLGYEIYADLSIKCKHLLMGGYNITIGDMSKVKRYEEK